MDRESVLWIFPNWNCKFVNKTSTATWFWQLAEIQPLDRNENLGYCSRSLMWIIGSDGSKIRDTDLPDQIRRNAFIINCIFSQYGFLDMI